MKVWSVCAAVVLVMLAGCAEEGKQEAKTDDDLGFDDVEVSATHGGIRGVAIDQGVNPVMGALVVLSLGSEVMQTETDSEGRFTFSNILEGTYFLEASKVQYETTQFSAEVVAGVAQPAIVKVHMTRLVLQDPYMTEQQLSGFFQCAYNFFISSTCVNDYTRLVPQCNGGCAPQLTTLVDNRNFVFGVDKGWQSMILEMTWEPSTAATGDAMGLTLSYETRPSTSHFWVSASHGNPWLDRKDVNVSHSSESIPSGTDPEIPWDGRDDLLAFMAAGEGEVSIEQEFEFFIHTSYWAPMPEGWSFIAGDENPFGGT